MQAACEPPPPPAVDVTVDPVARFDSRTGSATLSGTITCDEGAFAFLEAATARRRPSLGTVVLQPLTNPVTIACASGVAASLTGWLPPEPVLRPIELVAAMAVLGFRKLTEPIPKSPSAADPTCSSTEKQVQKFLSRGDVQVSVFNAGTRRGLAGRVQEGLVERGFQGGDVANAPPALRDGIVVPEVSWESAPLCVRP